MSEDKVYVANGEQAIVKEVHDKYIVAELQSQKTLIRIPVFPVSQESDDESDGDDKKKKDGSGCDWDLAFAITVHRAQGSQWPIVIVCLDDYPGSIGEFGVADRSWLYTALSRAQVACFMVGMVHTAHAMTRRSFINRRKTFLAETIREMAAKAGVPLRVNVVEKPDEVELW